MHSNSFGLPKTWEKLPNERALAEDLRFLGQQSLRHNNLLASLWPLSLPKASIDTPSKSSKAQYRLASPQTVHALLAHHPCATPEANFNICFFGMTGFFYFGDIACDVVGFWTHPTAPHSASFFPTKDSTKTVPRCTAAMSYSHAFCV
jgi:hypothetical protein